MRLIPTVLAAALVLVTVVSESPARAVPEPPTAKQAATRLVAAANHDRVAAMRRIAVRSVVRDLRRDVRQGATLERGRCFGRDDEEWGEQLGGARRGCLVEATGEMTYELDVLQLALRDGRWRAVGLRVVALS